MINSRKNKFVQDKMYTHDLVVSKMYILIVTEILKSHFMKILI